MSSALNLSIFKWHEFSFAELLEKSLVSKFCRYFLIS